MIIYDSNIDVIKKYATSIEDADILVVIGYTFPFFNREIDRMIFSQMECLQKIYIQDPNANNIVGNKENNVSKILIKGLTDF